MTAMEFRVLGPLEVIGPHGPIAIGSGRQRAILALLVLHIGETVSADRLIDEVWSDDPPRSAHHALEVHISGLRHALGPTRIETQPGGYRLRSEGNRVDFRRFETIAADASTALSEGDRRVAATRFGAALALWRGPAFAETAAGPTARAAGARLDELRAIALERRVDAELALGRHLELIPELRSIVAEMPLREAFQARLMVALYQSGRQAEALAVYHAARAVLSRDLGVEPGPELEATQRAVLAHDPALSVAVEERPRRPVANRIRPGGDRGRDQASQQIRSTGRQRETRRTVTVLMADLAGSTLLGEPLDPESARHPFDRCFEEIRAVVERHGGTVELVVGDAVMAVFGVPITHEDDALRAVRAASEMRTSVGALNDDLERHLRLRVEMRVGVNTGEVVATSAGDRARPFTGHAVNIAGRLQQAAGPGEILLGERSRHLVRDAVEVGPAESIELRGRAEPVIAYRLERVAGLHGHRRRLDGPLVGRDREIDAIRHAFAGAVSASSCHLVTILGAAGVGKSRLVEEFLGEIRDRARVLRGRCVPYGEGITYWPVAEIVRQAAGIADHDTADTSRARIETFVAGLPEAAAIARGMAGIIGLEGSAAQDELFWAFRRAVEHLADERPLVILIEDIHWAEPTLIDLLQSVAERARDARILLICPARPELLDERRRMGNDASNATTIALEPLSREVALELVDSIVPAGALQPGVRARIADAAEGNPLFVEEFLDMLIDGGALVGDPDDQGALFDLHSIGTPPTIQALMSARLDRLEPEDRAVAERASVVGRVFDRPSILALSPVGDRPDIPRSLATLVRQEVIRPDGSRLSRGETFRFRHMLIRDAAYEGLLKAERADLHELLADWIDLSAADGRTASEEVAGHHLEQAFRFRTALEPIDEHGRDLARRAAARLISAGRRALARSDIGATVNLLGRASTLLDPADPARLGILPDLARALDSSGQTDAAKACFDEAVTRAEAAHDERALAHARIQQYLSGSAGPGAGSFAQRQVASESVAVFERYRDDRGLAFAWHLHGAASLGTADGEPSLWRALEYARTARDHHEEAAIVLGLSAELFQGPTPVREAIRRCEAIVAHAPDDRAIEMAMAHALAHLRARLREFATARQHAARCQEIAEESGQPWRAAFLTEAAWDVEMLAGDHEAARRIIAAGCDRLAAMGDANTILEGCLVLSDVALGRAVDIERLTETAVAQTGWLRALLEATLAAALANVGRVVEAEQLARASVDFFAGTDFLTHHADALLILAKVLRAGGRPEWADAALLGALDLYRRKGTLVVGHTPTARLAAWAAVGPAAHVRGMA